MNKKEALKVLIDYQLWRRGSDDVPMATPKQLGEAIDVAIKELKKPSKKPVIYISTIDVESNTPMVISYAEKHGGNMYSISCNIPLYK